MLSAIRKLFSSRANEGWRQRLEFPAGTFDEIYAIGDVHGCLTDLLSAEARIAAIARGKDSRKLIVTLGDYVDRGTNSSGVLEHLLSPPPPGFERICICGNHDDAFVQYMIRPDSNRGWLEFGGEQTLLSYGIDVSYYMRMDPKGASLAMAARSAIPAEHIALLKDLPVSLKVGRILFVHAGIVPGQALDDQTDEDMMWIREPFLSEGPRSDLIVIHGHTPVETISFGKRRIGVDTGAYITGKLQVLRINDAGYSII